MEEIETEKAGVPLQKKFTLLIILIIFGAAIINTVSYFTLESQLSDSIVINTAGRQRMLSQKMSKEVATYALGIRRDANREKALQTMDLFDRSLKALIKGNEQWKVPATKDSKILKQLLVVQKTWSQFRPKLESVLGEQNSSQVSEELRMALAQDLNLLVVSDKVVKLYEQQAQQKIQNLQMIMVISFFILLVCVGFIHWFTVHFITQPIRGVSAMMKDIAQNEGDLTYRFTVKLRDEIGDLQSWFNHFLNTIQSIIKDINTNSIHLNDSSKTIKGSAIEAEKVIDDILAGTHTRAAAIRKADPILQEMNRSSTAVSQQFEELIQESSETESSAVEGTEAIRRIIASMDKINQNSKKIGGIVNVITGISNQTNLLSLNAAIEAAKAGEYGKGFAVVADQVKTLAEQSKNSVFEINHLIEMSAADVHEGDRLILQTGEILHALSLHVQKNTAKIGDFSKIIHDQNFKIGEVAEIFSVVLQISDNNEIHLKNLADQTREQTQTAEEMNLMAKDLKRLVDRFEI